MKIPDTAFKVSKVKTYNQKLITSLQEYLAYIEYLKTKWEPDRLWYRGVSKSTYEMIPGMYREGTWEYDEVMANDIFYDFIRQAKANYLNQNQNYSKWEWYHIMQHFGLPTRLLDWTEGALIGLFFALRDLDSISIPCVWVLEPYWLNQESTGSNVLFYTDPTGQTAGDTVANLYIEDHLDLPDNPIAIAPPYIDPRIKTQHSCFTVHGKNYNGIKLIYQRSESPKVLQLRISNRSAEKIMDDIISAGITEYTLFPDLEGLARELKLKYGLQ